MENFTFSYGSVGYHGQDDSLANEEFATLSEAKQALADFIEVASGVIGLPTWCEIRKAVPHRDIPTLKEMVIVDRYHKVGFDKWEKNNAI